MQLNIVQKIKKESSLNPFLSLSCDFLLTSLVVEIKIEEE